MDRFFASTNPFNQLRDNERKRLAEAAQEKSYAKGEVIFREGEPSTAIWVVKTGRVHVMKLLRNGKVSTTCVMTQCELFCCLAALDRKHYPADAIAAVDSTLVRIPARVFHQMMSRSTGFAQETLLLFCERLRQLEHKGSMLYEPVERRLAQVLLGLSRKFGDTVPLTRHELAEIAGTTHESAIRALGRLGEQGLVRSSRGRVTIVSREKLDSLLK